MSFIPQTSLSQKLFVIFISFLSSSRVVALGQHTQNDGEVRRLDFAADELPTIRNRVACVAQ